MSFYIIDCPIVFDTYENLFNIACRDGNLCEAERLLKVHNIDIHNHADLAFRLACCSGQLPVAKWLKSMGGVNHHACGDCAFRPFSEFGYGGYEHVLRWLHSLDGTEYFPTVRDLKYSLQEKNNMRMSRCLSHEEHCMKVLTEYWRSRSIIPEASIMSPIYGLDPLGNFMYFSTIGDTHSAGILLNILETKYIRITDWNNVDDVNAYHNFAQEVVRYGTDEFVKWFASRMNYDVHIIRDIFYMFAYGNHVALMDKVHKLFGFTPERYDDLSPFWRFCWSGNLDVVKYIWSICHFNYHYRDDLSFVESVNVHDDVATWLWLLGGIPRQLVPEEHRKRLFLLRLVLLKVHKMRYKKMLAKHRGCIVLIQRWWRRIIYSPYYGHWRSFIARTVKIWNLHGSSILSTCKMLDCRHHI